MIKSSFVVLLPALFISLSAAQASGQINGPLPKSDVKIWREDLAVMAREMPATHKDLFHKMSRESFDAAVKRLNERIPALSRNQIIVEMMRIVAMVGDGHTNIYPTRDQKIGVLSVPIKLYLFKDGMFVRAADKAHADLVGSRVMRIGTATPDEAVVRVAPLIGHDNEMGVKFFAPVLLAMPEVLNAIGLSDSSEKASLTLERNGRQQTIQLAGSTPVDMTAADTDLSWLGKAEWQDMRDAAGTTPLWLSDPENVYWYRTVPGTKTVYAQINQVGNKPDESLADFSKRLISFVESSRAEKLIVDLRLNRGGNGELLKPLEIALVKSKIDQPGHLFFLIGRSTWSAAQFLVNWTEKYTNAVFIGEPSASRGNVYGDSRKITLPNSGVTVRVSVYYWQDWPPWDTRAWTGPQVAAELTSADYAKGRDPGLAAVLNYTPRKALIDELNDALAAGGADAAVRKFREFKSDPINKFADTEDALLTAGLRLRDEKKPADALRLFQLDHEENPQSARAYFVTGIAYADLGDKRLAIENLEKALSIDPKNYDVSQLLKELKRAI